MIGVLLLVNLLAPTSTRFQFSAAKPACLLIHAGLILLLRGFFVRNFPTENPMRHRNRRNDQLAEDSPRNELVVLDVTDPDQDHVFAVPQAFLEKGGDIRPSGLPFALRVKHYLPNSLPAGPMSGDAQTPGLEGLGQPSFFTAAPLAAASTTKTSPRRSLRSSPASRSSAIGRFPPG